MAGGDAVFQARGLLSLSGNILYYNDNVSCFPSAIRKKESNKVGSVKLFPNPTSGKLNLKISSDLFQEYNLEIYSTSGTLIKSISFKGFIINEAIDLTDLSQGIYLYKLNSKNSEEKGYIVIN